jgi:hypothetical protein
MGINTSLATAAQRSPIAKKRSVRRQSNPAYGRWFLQPTPLLYADAFRGVGMLPALLLNRHGTRLRISSWLALLEMEAVMLATDSDYDTHVQTYRGFVRALRYAIAAAAVSLLLLAYFLL